ncbi:MAG TPA: DUF6538 domain-containing protein [Pseudolabrys sp.]|nr:DUF6538 domain-containing protein [Pseudolabrys sp.]
MAALSYMQRRVSGTYEFRKRLPERLAGKEAPAHMREAFGDLINAKTGCFKRELVLSLQTKDLKQAKRRDHQEALRAARLGVHLDVLHAAIWLAYGPDLMSARGEPMSGLGNGHDAPFPDAMGHAGSILD